MSDRRTYRLSIKKAVQQAVPMMDIDVTKVLSDEESAELHRQIRQRSDAVKLAKKIGRDGLLARLKMSALTNKCVDVDDDRVTEADHTLEQSS